MDEVLDPASIDENRAGRLTDAQRKRFAAVAGASRGQARGVGLVLVAIGVLVLVGGSSSVAMVTRLLVAGGAFAAGALIVIGSVVYGRGLSSDVAAGRVATVEGPVGRTVVRGTGAQPSTHFLEVGGRRYRCYRDAYDAAAQPGIVRLFVLPRSGRVVNMERLPDRPLAAGSLTPQAAFATAASAVGAALTGRTGAEAEALATMAAMEHAALGFEPGSSPVGASTVPAPASAVDTRSAIVGTWANPLLTATFSADGSVHASMLTGMTLAGSWSIGPGGRLLLTGIGGEESVEAQLEGDALTATLDGRALRLHRVSA